MSNVVCPHCGANNAPGAAFCESCGKALPLASTGAGPRVVTANSLPASAAGQQMLGEQLQKTTKRAANTLLTVGIIQIVIGSILGLVVANAPGGNRDALPLLVGIPVVLGLIFIGLSFWARKNPLPAAIIGLVLYATLIAVNVIVSISQLSNRDPADRGGGFGGIGIGWLDIVIMVFLSRGIKAAIDHRKLERGDITTV